MSSFDSPVLKFIYEGVILSFFMRGKVPQTDFPALCTPLLYSDLWVWVVTYWLFTFIMVLKWNCIHIGWTLIKIFIHFRIDEGRSENLHQISKRGFSRSSWNAFFNPWLFSYIRKAPKQPNPITPSVPIPPQAQVRTMSNELLRIMVCKKHVEANNHISAS